MYLSVIIPAYNEEKRIEKTLIRVDEFLRTVDYPYEVIVVNDGSTDTTEKIVNDFVGAHPNFRQMYLAPNHGKGYCVKHGMLEAKGDYRLFMDADNSTDIAEVNKLLKAIEEYDCEIAVSSRKIKGSIIINPQPPLRIVLGNIFKLLVRAIVPVGIIDTQNGFKLFTAKATEIVFPKQTLYRWAFDVEILAIARKQKLKIIEVPIVWNNDDRSKMKLSGMINMLMEIVEVRAGLFTGKYL